jgi:hypothetical protein
MPVGAVMVLCRLEELIATQPTSIALGRVVVTPGTTPSVAAGPAAVVAGTSSGVAVSTPEYRTIPPLFTTEEERPHV